MKKLLLFTLLLIGGRLLSYGQSNNIPMQIVNNGGASHGNTLAPPRPWYITQDENVLTLPAFDEGFTLQLLDEEETIVYSSYVPAGTTQIILPSTLSGSFELRLIPFLATYYYRGYISL